MLSNLERTQNSTTTRFRGFVLVLFATLGVTACEQYVARERVGGLKKDIAAVAAQIKAAEVEDAQYSGGLIKALIGARLATLRHTHAMLDQRAKSWTVGIGLRYTVDGKTFVSNPTDKEQASALERELAELRVRTGTGSQSLCWGVNSGHDTCVSCDNGGKRKHY